MIESIKNRDMSNRMKQLLIFLAGGIAVFSWSFFSPTNTPVNTEEELLKTKEKLEVLDSLYSVKRVQVEKYKDKYRESLTTLEENSILIDSLSRMSLEILYDELNEVDEDSLYYELVHENN